MSKTVDTRVVEMEFDNSSFERGVSSTLKSLNKLQQGLTLEKEKKNVTEVKDIADKISFDSAITETGKFGDALGSLKDTARSAFDRISNGLSGLVKGYKIAKGVFSVGVLGKAVAGGWNRASNLNMASFKLDTMNIGWERVADQVNASVDGTAYSLDAAATAAAAFAASGVGIREDFDAAADKTDQMYEALRAVANVSSITGSNYEAIAEIFTKVSAKGVLGGEQMDSLQLHGLQATQILAEYKGTDVEGILKMQREKMLSFDDLVNAVNAKYGDAAAAANKSFDGALANMNSALNRVFAPFFQAAQTAIIPIFNGIREVINMITAAAGPLIGKEGVLTKGVAGILEEVGKAFHIFGGKREDGTDLNGGYISMAYVRFARIFKGIADLLKDPLEEIRKGTTDLVYGFLEIGAIGREILRLGGEALAPIIEAFTEVFGDGAFSKGTRDWRLGVEHILDTIADLHISEGVITSLKGAFMVLFSTVKGIGTVAFETIGGAINFVFDAIQSVGLGIGAFIDGIAGVTKSAENEGTKAKDAFGEFIKSLKKTPVIGQVIKLIEKIPKGISKISDVLNGKEGSIEALSKFLGGVNKNFAKLAKQVGDGLGDLGEGLKNFAQGLKDTAFEKAQWLFDRIKAIGEFLSPVVDHVIKLATGVKDVFKRAFKDAGFDIAPFQEFFDKIGKLFDQFFKEDSPVKFNLGALAFGFKDAFGELTEKIGPSIERFAKSIGEAILDHLPQPLKDLKKQLDEVTGPFEAFQGILKGFSDMGTGFKWPWENGSGEPVSLDVVANFIGSSDKTGELQETADETEESKGLIGTIFDNIFEIVEKVLDIPSKIGDDVKGPIDKVGDLITHLDENLPWDKIKSLAGSITAIGIDAIVIKGMYDGLQAVKAIGGFFEKVTEAIGGISESLTSLSSTIKDFQRSYKIHMITELIISIAILIGAIAAVAHFSDADKMKEILPVIEELMAVIAIMIAFMVVITSGKFGKLAGAVDFASFAVMSKAVERIAISVGIMVAAIYALGKDLKESQIENGVNAIAKVVGLIAAMLIVMGKTSGAETKGVASAMLAMSVSIWLMYNIISKFSEMDSETFEKGYEKVAWIAALYIALAAVMGIFSGGIKKGSASKSSSVAAAILAMTVGIMLICQTIIDFAKQLKEINDPAAVAAAVGIIVLVGILIVAAVAFLTSLEQISAKAVGASVIVGSILAMTVAVGVITLAIIGLTRTIAEFGWDRVVFAAAILGGLILILGLMVTFMTTGGAANGVGALTIAVALISLAIAIGVFVAAIILLSLIPMDTIVDGLTKFIAVAVVFAGALIVFGAIGELAGPGLIELAIALQGIAWSAVMFAGAVFIIAAAVLVGVGALTLFAMNEPMITKAFEHFVNTIFQMTQQEGFVVWMGLATAGMFLFGIAAAVFGIGVSTLILPALALLGTMTKETAENVLEFFNIIHEHHEEFANGFAEMIEIAIEAVGNVFKTIGEKIVGWFNESMENNSFEEMGKGLVKVGEAIFSFFAGFFMEAGPKILNFFKENVIDPMGKAIGDFLHDKVWNGIGQAGAALAYDPAMNPLDPAYDPNSGTYYGAELAKQTGEGYEKEMKENVAPHLAEATKEAVSSAGDAGKEAAGEKGEEIAQETVDKTKEGVEAAKSELDSIGKGMDWMSILGLSPEQFENLKQEFSDKTGGLSLEALGAFSTTMQGYDFDVDMMDLVTGEGGLNMEILNSYMSNGALDAAKSYEGSFKEHMGTVDMTSFIAGKDQIDLEAIKSQFGAAGKAGSSAFVSELTNGSKKATLKEGIDNAIKSAEKNERFKEVANKDGKAAVSGLKEGAADLDETMASEVKSTANTITDYKDTIYNNSVELGRQAGQGLIDGLNAMRDLVSAAAAELGNAAVVGAGSYDGLDTGSPSKKMHKLGVYAGEGLITGMESMRKNVEASGTELGHSSVLAATSEMSYITGLMDDIDDNPVIRPVLDLTDYEAGIGRMGSINSRIPTVSAQWANRLSGSGASPNADRYNQMNITLNYDANADATQMVYDMARLLRTRNLMEA